MNWKEKIISALNKNDIDTALKTAAHIEFEELFPVVDALTELNPSIVSAFLHELGIFYYHNGEIFPAEKMFKKAMVESETDIEAALISIDLGNLYHTMQQFTKAEIVYTKALKILRIHAEQNPGYVGDLALVLMNLGLVYWNKKQFLKAEEMYTESLQKYRKLTEENPAYSYYLATTLNNVGILYQNTNRLLKAEPVHKEALSLLRNCNKTPDTLTGIGDALLHLGNLYWKTTQFTKAENMFEEALKLRRALFEKTGCHILDVVLALNNLGNLYKDTHKYLPAEKMYTEALKMSRKIADEDFHMHTWVGLILNNLGVLYLDIKHITKAENMFEEALKIRRALFEKNPEVHTLDVGMTLNNIGLLYRNTGEYSKSEAAYKEALQRYNCAEIQDMSEMARTLNNIGVLYSDMYEFSKAEYAYKKALKIYNKIEDHTEALGTAGTLRNMGNLYRDAKRFDKAEKMYNKALTMYTHLEKNDSAFTPYAASIFNDMGIFYQDTRRYYEAETAFKKALKRRLDLFRKNPQVYAADLAGTWNNLGILYNDAHLHGNARFEEAETVYKKALDTFEQLKKEYPKVFTPHVAGMLHNMGALYKDVEQVEKAESVHKKALELRIECARKSPDVYTREVADSLTSLGMVYEKMGNKKAGEYYRKALEKYKEFKLWFDAANVCYNLSQVESDKKILDKARKLIEMGILFSKEKKYVYAQKGLYEQVYWGLLKEGMSSFGVFEALRDPVLLSLPWEYILSNKDIEKAQKDTEFQKRLVNKILRADIPSVKILKGLLKRSLFVYVQNFQEDVLLLFVVGDTIQKYTCTKEFLTLGEKLLHNLGIQQGAAQKTDNFENVTEKFDDLSKKWSALLPEELKELIRENEYIIFSPDNYCSYFPLEALLIDGAPVCMKKTVVRATSVHQFSNLLKRNPSFDSSFIVGNPWPECDEERLVYSLLSGPEKFDIPFLNGAQKEAETLAKTLPNSIVLVGHEASGKRFISEISQHSLIHFSGHGDLGRILFLSGPFKGFPPSFEPEEFSDLRKAERIEGTKRINMMEEWHPVTDLDLFDVKLQDGAVVFLNACETGQHKYAGGGYYQGLPAVFLKNGAHSVISSLVPIFDEHSKEFAIHFYDNLLDTHSVAASLRKARTWAKNKYKAHIYWIPYIHHGPPL